MEQASPLGRPNGPSSTSQVARALDAGRATPSRQAEKEKQVHRSNDRVMPIYGREARRTRKKDVDPDRASEVVPNLLRELTDECDPDIVCAITLADRTRV